VNHLTQYFQYRKRVFLVLILSISITSCRTYRSIECIKYGTTDKHEIFIHWERIGNSYKSISSEGERDSATWDEYDLVITNYRNNTMTIKEFVDIAQKFIDTSKSENPIGDIVFLGQAPHGCIPSEKDNPNVFEKYCIIDIGFEATHSTNPQTSIELTSITFYRKGIPLINSMIRINNPITSDSVLNSKKTIQN
jgi:hypothetical protein